MIPFELAVPSRRMSILCLGAHSDDIEIGLGGTLLKWLRTGIELDVYWFVASAVGSRRNEAEKSAAAFLKGASSVCVELADFKDGYFPYQGADLKTWVESVRARISPDIVFTHRRDDAHQDHRELCKLTWNSFRDHVVMEYEIPKWDGDMGQPNLYVPIEAIDLERKLSLLEEHFGTQRKKDWFDAETFRGLARLRGMECRAEERYAEAFIARKLCLS
ncbi:MAG: PIG-L family deacetylase [Proteobacteria bacterium]|nr:PIG-L family deacetylase [Pseudomonadota bacterium]